MANDYYDTLGVSKNASDAEIKQAFRKLAMKYHPDKNQGDKAAEQKFKEINEAYDVLKDPQKKAAYDQYGSAAFSNGGSGFNAGGAGFGGGAGFSDFGFGGGSFSDIFEDLFSGATGGRRSQRSREPGIRGSDLRYNLELTLEEAFNGKNIEITLNKYDKCEKCNGSGAEAGSKPQVCPKCHGSGVERTQQGFFAFERTCSSCGGVGSIIKNPCAACRGSGRVYKKATVAVSIPAGVEDGVRIRVPNAGEAGTFGGAYGDLYIYTKIKPHKFFERDGKDLHCEVPISIVKAALGCEVEVPGIDNVKSIVKIPEGAENGQILKLRQKGMKAMRSNVRGDLFVHIHVETPQNLTARQKDRLREFDSISDTKKTSPKCSGFWEKLKEML